MATKKEKKEEKQTLSFDELDEKAKNKLIGGAFETLNSFSNQTSFLDQAQSNINAYEDSGCYILNALLSGDFRGGFPEGRMSLLAAPSGVGKSYIGLQTAAIAQKKGKFIVIFDSEYAIDKEFGKNLGLDPSKVKYFPVESVEQCKNALYKFLKYVIDNKLNGKFFVLVDSLAAMITEMDMKRAEDDNSATDMGTRARAMKSFLQMCITMSGQSNTTIICTNHIYDDPSAMHPSMVKPMPGGRCVTYLPSTIVQLSSTNVKEKDGVIDEEATTNGKGMIGKAVTGVTVKNRVCKPFVKADMIISYKKGLLKYYGLLELALSFGIITYKGGRYYSDPECKNYIGTRKELQVNSEFWEKFIDSTMQEALDAEWKYSSKSDMPDDDQSVLESLGDDLDDISAEDDEDI